MAIPAQDITGKVFKNLRVVRKTEMQNKKQSYLWELLCTCGETCFATAADLNRGRYKFCKSCRDKEAFMSPYKCLFGNYKRGATSRDYEYSLSLEQFISIVNSDCFYCGEPPSQWYKKEGAREGVYYNGIDREKNNVGYTPENSKPCCKFCNFAKKTFDAEELTSWLDRVTKRRRI